LSLGETLSNVNAEDNKYVMAIAVPSRSYAAAFICSAFAISNLLNRSYEDAEYIDLIHSLPEGTSVKFFDNGKVKKAIKKNIQPYDGLLLVGIQIEGGTTQYIRPENVHKIQIADKNYEHLPNRQAGRTVVPPSELLNALFPDRANDYVYKTKIEGIIVGSKNALQQECALPLAVLSNSKKQQFQGNLNDLFRVEGFTLSNTGHRFAVHASGNNDISMMSLENLAPNPVAIFDGALGFVKWKEIFRNNNWIVILDRTDANFSDAVSQINAEYTSRSERAISTSFPLPLSGIEMMYFRRNS
jgi:hypothetical protein